MLRDILKNNINGEKLRSESAFLNFELVPFLVGALAVDLSKVEITSTTGLEMDAPPYLY